MFIVALFAGAKQKTNPEHKMNAYSSGTDEVEYGVHTVEYQLLKRGDMSIGS